MDYLNLPLYVWILVISIVVILIALFVFIMKRRAKEARELDAMFEPAWDNEEGGVDRATIQRRRREMRARRQKEYESRIDRGAWRDKEQEKKEESERFSTVKEEQELRSDAKKGLTIEDQDETLDQEEQKPLHSAPTESKLSTSKEVEQGELKQDPSLGRLGSLPPLGRWQEEKSPIGEGSTSEQVHMERGSLPPRGKRSSEFEGTMSPESPKELQTKDAEQPVVTRSSLQDTGFRRLGGLPPLDTSRFQQKKERDSDLSKEEHGLAGNEKESPYRPIFSGEETMGEFSLKEKDLQSLDGGLPPRGVFRPEQKSTEESGEEKRIHLRRSTFLRDKEAEEVTEKQQEDAPSRGVGLPSRRAFHSSYQGMEEPQETMKQQEREESKPRRVLRRSQALSKEIKEPSISKDNTSPFDGNLSSEGISHSDHQESEAPLGKEQGGEESGPRRRFLRRSLPSMNEESEALTSQEKNFIPTEEKLFSRSASHPQSQGTEAPLGTREQRETNADNQQKRILRRSSAPRSEELITSSKQGQDHSFGNHSFPLQRTAEDELQQRMPSEQLESEEDRETRHSSDLQPDLGEKQEPSYSELGQGLGPRRQRQKSRWKMPWGKKE